MTLRADGGGGGILSGSTPISGGADTQVLFNDGGVVGGNSNFLFIKATADLRVGRLNIGVPGMSFPVFIFGNTTAGNNGVFVGDVESFDSRALAKAAVRKMFFCAAMLLVCAPSATGPMRRHSAFTAPSPTPRTTSVAPSTWAQIMWSWLRRPLARVMTISTCG